MGGKRNDATGVASADWLAGGGEMGRLIREMDWSRTPLGPIEIWPQSLKTAINIMLNSRYPMFVWWGRELINIYNDAYIPMLGARHPLALGQSASRIWADVWPVVGPQTEQVTREDRATWNESILLLMDRCGYTEETHFTFSHGPARDDEGDAGGVFRAVAEDIRRALEEPHDFPFALICLLEGALAENGLPSQTRERLEVARRNSLRLLRLVNTLLDFSPVEAERTLASTGLRGEAYVEEAPLWLPGMRNAEYGAQNEEGWIIPALETDADRPIQHSAFHIPHSRILFADDNADMREYVRQLLAANYEVVAVADGEAALEAAREQSFDLILTDVMMPRLDGFGLLKALRAGGGTRTIPVILLSARAGEESRVAGLEAGADDYLVKPFSARELLARVEAHLQLQRVRRETEAAAREGEARLSAVLEQLPVGLGVMDRHGRWVVSNAPMRAFMRETIPSRDPQQMSRWRIFDEGGNPVRPHEWPGARALRGQIVSPGVEAVYIADDGREIWTQVSAAPLRDEAGEIIGAIAVVEDIDKRKQAEERLRQSEERYRGIVNQSVAGIAKTDLTGRFITVNDHYCKITGYSREELLKLRMQEITRPEDLPRNLELFEKLVAGGEPFEIEKRYIRKDGSEVWVHNSVSVIRDARGGPRSTIAVSIDITERKRAEERIRDSEERFRALANNIPQFAWMADATGWIFWYNRRWYEYTGATLEEMRGWGWQAVHHPDHVERVTARFKRSIETGEEWEDTFPLRGKDGNYRWFLSRAVPIRDDEGKIVRWFGVNTDITEQRQAERDAMFLSDLAERVRLADGADELMWEVAQLVGEYLQTARCCFIEIDTASGRGVIRRDYRRGVESAPGERLISDYSPAARAEMEAGRAVVNRDSQTDPRGAALYEATCGRTGERACVAVPLKRAGRWAATLWVSEERPRDWTPREIALLETVAERIWMVVERLRSEQSLRESETRYRATFDNAAVGIAHIGLDGRWLRFNDAICEITGYSREELLTKTFGDITHPDDIEADWAQARRVLAGEISTYSMEKRYIRKDGSITWINLTVSLMRDEAGVPRNFISVIEDISDRKRAEEEIARLLAEEQKLRETAEAATRAKDEFLGVISHELRSPLNAILGWSRLLHSQRGDDPQIAKVTETIERSGKAQLQLIEDLLDTTRIITGKMKLEFQPVELVGVISAALDTVRPAANNKGIVIAANLDPKAGQITGDPDRLQQVVWNLVSNAIKFTPEGGRVWVELRRGDTGVQIIVRDTGRGIRPDLLPYVFDRFKQGDSTTSRRFGGLGLGLALVKHLVELHGGSAVVESPGEDQGATFTVNLPVRAVRGDSGTGEQKYGEARVDRRAHRRTRTARLEGVRALVVDDEAGARELLTITLEQHGVSVACADSAEAAIAAIESRLNDAEPAPFDILISDIGMPGADGYELLRRVRAHADKCVRGLRAIALTAYARSEDRLRVLQAGFQMHVPKPVDEEELTIVIAALTNRISGGE